MVLPVPSWCKCPLGLILPQLGHTTPTGGKQRHVGRYRNELDAARAYDKAAYHLYGMSAM